MEDGLAVILKRRSEVHFAYSRTLCPFRQGPPQCPRFLLSTPVQKRFVFPDSDERSNRDAALFDDQVLLTAVYTLQKIPKVIARFSRANGGLHDYLCFPT